MKIDLPCEVGAASIEWLLIGLPALALVTILMALIGGGGAEKQTRRRIDRICESNAPRLAQSMVSIRLADNDRSEEHTSELQSLMRISYAVFCLKKKKDNKEYRYPNNKKQETKHRPIH